MAFRSSTKLLLLRPLHGKFFGQLCLPFLLLWYSQTCITAMRCHNGLSTYAFDDLHDMVNRKQQQAHTLQMLGQHVWPST